MSVGEGQPPAETFMWVKASNGNSPPGSVIGGHDNNGEPIYVARAQHLNALIPGKLIASHSSTYVSWDGLEIAKKEYEVLIGGPNLSWRQTNRSKIPEGSIPGGHDKNGEILFIGRVRYQGSVTTGKVQPSHGACYIPFHNKEHSFNSYEILVR